MQEEHDPIGTCENHKAIVTNLKVIDLRTITKLFRILIANNSIHKLWSGEIFYMNKILNVTEIVFYSSLIGTNEF